MRRVMVTPTFAAGLGVVIAAVMVYPMSRMVFSYGARCQVPGCGSGTVGGPGASAQPGRQMGAGADPASQPSAPPTSSGSGKVPPGQPVLSYQTLSQQDGSFTGEIVIDFQARSVPAKWALWISYPSARIVSVSGGVWQADNDHSGVISGTGPDGSSSDGGQLRVGFTVDSAAPGARPAGCTFNGKTCLFSDGSPAAGSVKSVSATPLRLGQDHDPEGSSWCKRGHSRTGHQSGPSPCHRKAA
jgi:hypothetical protein